MQTPNCHSEPLTNCFPHSLVLHSSQRDSSFLTVRTEAAAAKASSPKTDKILSFSFSLSQNKKRRTATRLATSNGWWALDTTTTTTKVSAILFAHFFFTCPPSGTQVPTCHRENKAAVRENLCPQLNHQPLLYDVVRCVHSLITLMFTLLLLSIGMHVSLFAASDTAVLSLSFVAPPHRSSVNFIRQSILGELATTTTTTTAKSLTCCWLTLIASRLADCRGICFVCEGGSAIFSCLMWPHFTAFYRLLCHIFAHILCISCL